MGAPGHMPGKVLGPGLTGNTTAAPQSFQVNKTFEHKTFTDLVRSDDGRELDEGRVEACERVTDPDPHLHEQGGDSAKGGGGWPPPPRRSKKCSKWWKPRSGMVLRTQEHKEDGPTLEVEEMIDSPAAAWTNTRNSTSTTMLLTLVDNKREAATAAMSFDPDLLIAYVNSSFQESNEEVGEADLLQQGQAERKLRSLTHPEKVLCRNRNIYQWGDSRAAICDVRPTKEERAKTDNYQSREEVIRNVYLTQSKTSQKNNSPSKDLSVCSMPDNIPLWDNLPLHSTGQPGAPPARGQMCDGKKLPPQPGICTNLQPHRRGHCPGTRQLPRPA